MLVHRLPTCLLLAAVAASGAQAQTREVMVVYDDSGSMGRADDPEAAWRYANYALQSLTGLLSSRDALSVVLMSAPTSPVTIDLERPAEEIAAIHRGYRARGRTPYETVRQAMALLERKTHEEETSDGFPTDKWLIVITDGDFQVEPAVQQTLREDIRSFIETTGARVIFLLIGGIEPAVARVWEQEAQAARYEARTWGEIIERMQRIAADVTARSPQNLPTEVQDRTVSIRSEFPLQRLTVMQQRARAEEIVVLETAHRGAGPLHVEPALTPRMPVGSSRSIAGHIVHLHETRPDAVIPAGSVRLRFDQAVDTAAVQVLPEVAARLAVWLSDAAGQQLSARLAVHELCAGDTVLVRATLVSPEGDTLIRQVQTPDHFDVRLQSGGDARPLAIDIDHARFETALVVAEGAEPISVSAAYPGYFNFQSRVFTVRGELCPSRALGLSTMPWSALVTELHRAPPLELLPTADGAQVSAEELEAWTVARVDGGRLPIIIERTAAGWQLMPQKRWGSACFTPTGRIPVELELRSGSPRDLSVRTTIDLEILNASFWSKCGALVLGILILVLFLVWLIGVLRKRRFCKGSEIEYERITGTAALRRAGGSGRRHTQRLPRGFVSRWLVPYMPERTSVNGVTFEAGSRCGHVIVPRQAQAAEMLVAGQQLADPGSRSVHLQKGEELEIRRGRHREVYRYNLYRSS